MKEIMRILPGITKRRIRRWRIEAGIPTKVADQSAAAKSIRSQLAAAWRREVKVFFSGDEQTHWSNHPEVNKYKKDPEYVRAKQRAYYVANKREIWKRIVANPRQKLRRTLRTRVYNVLKGLKKSAPTMEMVGCSREFLMEWLEKQFRPGMTWKNHGVHGWHIDHIIPCSKFDLADPEQQRRCFHYTNLQPLWANENWSKRNKILTPHQPQLALST